MKKYRIIKVDYGYGITTKEVFMFELIILNLKTNEKFSKFFDSEYLMNKFVKKAKYSNEIKIIGNFRRF